VWYLTIPLAIALLGVTGIAVMVWRKMPYLRKLTPEAHELGDTLAHDYVPEVLDWWVSIPWRQYVQTVLVELEKILRQVRLFMQTLDRLWDRMIRKVRRTHQEAGKQHEEIVAQQEVARQEKEEEDEDDKTFDINDPEQLKQEEQNLIVAIAQNPKDVASYQRIAQVYVRMDQVGDAIEALEAALKLDPENVRMTKRVEALKQRQAVKQL
jgi:tetratricopeptide (TPR) repeat protein